MTEPKLTPKKIRKLLHRELRMAQKDLGNHTEAHKGRVRDCCADCMNLTGQIEAYKTAIARAGGYVYD